MNKCAKCGRPMKKIMGANRIFKSKYIISDAAFFVCAKCGEEYIEPAEYERIRRKISSIESKKMVPAVQAVIAKAKFLVL